LGTDPDLGAIRALSFESFVQYQTISKTKVGVDRATVWPNEPGWGFLEDPEWVFECQGGDISIRNT